LCSPASPHAPIPDALPLSRPLLPRHPRDATRMAATTAASPAAPDAESRLAELGLVLDPTIRYRLDTVFPKVAGFGWKSAVQRKYGLIMRVEPVLRKALARSETVLYVVKGVQQSSVDQFLMGFWASSVNQAVFVLTDARILVLRTDANGRPKRTFWSIYHSRIESLRPSWTGVTRLRLRDGKRLKVTGFSQVDRNSMLGLVQQAIDRFRQHGFDPRVTQSMENLCSHCLTRVPKDEQE